MLPEQKDYSLFSAMQTGEYYSAYRKTIPARVAVTVLNPFNNEPEGILLEGEGEKSYVVLWNVMQDMFFRRMNKRHLDTGTVIPYTVPQTAENKEPTVDQFDDEALKALIKSPFQAFKNALNKTESVSTVHRIKKLAEELGVSVKIMKHIDARLSEIEFE